MSQSKDKPKNSSKKGSGDKAAASASFDKIKVYATPVASKDSSSKMAFVVKVSLFAILPYIFGVLFSSNVIPLDAFSSDSSASSATETTSTTTSKPKGLSSLPKAVRRQVKQMKEVMNINELGDPFSGVTLAIHQNGDKDTCATIAPSSDTLQELYNSVNSTYLNLKGRTTFSKYEVDAIMTTTLTSLLKPDQCYTKDKKKSKISTKSSKWIGGNSDNDLPSLLSYCDMGPDNTPIQLDHHKMVALKNLHIQPEQKKDLNYDHIYPCHYHTREGLRITSLQQLAELAREMKEGQKTCNAEVDENGNEIQSTCNDSSSSSNNNNELHLYAVPAGRVFMFAPKYVGEIFELPHVTGNVGAPVSLEVLSLNPRVFDIKNFFSLDEAKAIVTKALNEKSESHRIKRSSTGASGYNLNSKRTSENGFDTHGREAIIVKKRCFEVLGFDEYVESMADGLQVLRYNKTTAYVPHLDWIDDYQKQEEHNFDSGGLGSNRFATILLYMTDVPEDGGGETVFSKAWPPHLSESERIPLDRALKTAREEGVVADLKRGSWEEKMVAECRTRFSVKPNSAKAVLFYSQHEDGEPDHDSLHGGCPVLTGEKWAANLWVWNAPRSGYEGAPKNAEVVKRNRNNGKAVNTGPQQLHATFSNTGSNPSYKSADLYFQDTFWGHLGFNDPPLSVNTYEGHQWNIYVDGKPVKQWVINKDPVQQFRL